MAILRSAVGIGKMAALGLLAAVSTTAVAHAGPICGPLEQCPAVQAQAEAPIQALLQNRIPVLGDIVRNEDGSVRLMSQYGADQYCRSHGSRLPTARELALVSQSMGARGIRETAHAGVVKTEPVVQAEITQMLAGGYYPIYTMNGSNQPSVDFYFNSQGYRRPDGELGDYFFWSSSVHPDDSDYAYTLHGVHGFIVYYGRSDDNDDSAVRCVR